MSTLSGTAKCSPLFIRLLESRGFSDSLLIEKFLFAGLDQLEDPLKMKGMREAVERLRKAVTNKEKILVHGDYDVDGVTATAVLAKTLQILKADYFTFVPERARDGYGISEDAIRKFHTQGVSILMTADCGIAAHDEIQVARSLGMDVIVIDHHRIPAQGLPQATIILNPQQEDCGYPSQDLSAAGLAFKLAQALIGNQALNFLDLAALSTVADIAPLRDENRIIVRYGLKQLADNPNFGLQALIKSAGIRSKQLNTGHLGFMLGPRINACGRMSTPEIALRLLVSENLREAESLASVLEEENKLRQKEERQIVKDAIEEAERTAHFNRDRVVVVGKQGWHQGVVGIVASRLVERFSRPALVIGFDASGGKGSGRSVKGFNLFQALESCRDLLQEFGGHEQAVGLSMAYENLPLLRKKINEYAQAVPADIFVRQVRSDLKISLQDLNTHFMEELQWLEPHGAGNPRPVFETQNLLIRTKPVTLSPQTVQFFVTDGRSVAEAVWSNRNASGFWVQQGMEINLFYHAKIKKVNGIESLVLDVRDAQKISSVYSSKS